jgi:hypothetical protein
MTESEPRPSVEFDAIRLIYKLSEILYYQLPDRGIEKDRLIKMCDYIRDRYDESVWKS